MAVEILNRKPSIEVNETVSFKLIAVAEEPPWFYINFGDGSEPVRTKDTSIIHAYNSHGNFSVHVKTWDLCNINHLTTVKFVSVAKHVGYLNDLLITANTVTLNVKTIFNLRVKGGIDFECDWNFGDNSTAKTPYETHGAEQTVQHMYQSPGRYNATVFCSNRQSSKSKSFSALVLEPVKGLMIHSVGPQRADKAFNVSWKIDRGTQVTFQAHFADHILKVHTINDKQGWAVIDPTVVNNQKGSYNFVVNASNIASSTQQESLLIVLHVPIAPFTINVRHSHRYIEVNDTVAIAFSSNNINIHAEPVYYINLGDGSTVRETNTLEIQHSYKTFGEFIVNVTAINPISSYISTGKVIIMRPVVLLKDLSLTVSPARFTFTSILQIRLAEGSDFTCQVRWGDGSTENLDYSHLAYYKDGATSKTQFTNLLFEVHHLYQQNGSNTVIAYCRNRLSTTQSMTNAVVQVPVHGFYLLPTTPKIMGDSFLIEWITESGTELEFHILWNGKVLSPVTNGKRGFAQVTSADYSEPGIYPVEVSVRNLVTMPVVLKESVIIEVPISDVSIDVYSMGNHAEVNETLNITVIAGIGSYPMFTIDLGDGTDLITTDSNLTQHSYNPQGEYTITVMAFNKVSRKTINSTVKVLKPVLAIQGMTIQSLVGKVREPLEIKMQLDQGSDLQCNIDFGDGTNFLTELMLADFYSNGYIGELSRFSHIKKTFKHTYDYPKRYFVNIECENRKSKVTSNTLLHISEPISGLKVDSVSPKAVGKSFFVLWSISTGTDVTFEVSFIRQHLSLPPSFAGRSTTVLTSSKVGFHLLRITATNLVTSPVTVTTPVIVEEALSGLEVYIENTNLYTEAEEDIKMVLKLRKGSNPNFKIDFGDNSPILRSQERRIIHRYGIHPDYIKGMEAVNYLINVEAWNNISSTQCSAQITVYKPVIRLSSAVLEAYPTKLGMRTLLNLKISQGSDMSCEWEFGDSSFAEIFAFNNYRFIVNNNTNRANFRSIQLSYEHLYSSPGIYIINVKCWNRLSQIKTSATTIVQEGVDGLLIHSIPIKEEGEKLNISWTISAGTNVSYTVQFRGQYLNNIIVSGLTGHIMIDEYTNYGNYNFTLIADNLVSEPKYSSITVYIEQSIEQLTVTAITLNASLEQDGHWKNKSVFPIEYPIKFAAEHLKGSNIKYRFSITGINGVIISKSIKRQLSLVLPFHGEFVAECWAFNNISNSSYVYSFTVLETIKGLSLYDIEPQVFSRSFNVSWFTQAGTSITYELSFGDYQEFIAKPNAGKVTRKLDASYIGVFPLSVKANNLVSPTLTQTNLVIIEQPIRKLQLIIKYSGQYLEVGDPISICHSLKVGTNPKYRISFGNGDPDILTTHPCVNYSYSAPSIFENIIDFVDYNVTTSAWNNISHVIKYATVTLHKPVITLSKLSVESQPTNLFYLTSYTLNLKSGSDFICQWSYGDGNKKNVSHSHIRYTSSKKSKQYEFMDIILQHKYRFESIGAYLTSVKCWNRISEVQASCDTIVQQSISGLNVIPVGVQTEGKPFNVSWSLQAGSGISYTLKFDNVSLQIFRDGDSGGYATITGDKPSGSYLLELKAHNLVSNPVITSMTVNIESAISRFTLKTSFFNGSMNAMGFGQNHSVFPLEHEVFFEALVLDGSSINYRWRVTTENDVEVAVSERKKFSTVFPEHGRYKVKCDVFNNITRIQQMHWLTLLQSVQGLKLKNIKPQKCNNTFTVSWTLNRGTDVSYNVLFHNTSSPLAEKLPGPVAVEFKSTKAGVYRVVLTAINLISPPLSVSTWVTIEEPVAGLNLHVVHTSRYIEINENVKLVYTLSKGSNPKFRINFGDLTSDILTELQAANHTYHLHPAFKNGLTSVYYTVNVTAWNNVSSISKTLTLTVHKPVIPIPEIFLESNATILTIKTKFTLYFYDGSDFKCEWDHGDGTKETVNYNHSQFLVNGNDMKQDFKNSQVSHFHRYSAANSYLVKVSCWNRLSRVHTESIAIVQESIKGIQLNKTPIQTEGTAFNVSWITRSGTNVSCAAYLGTWKIYPFLTDDHNWVATVPSQTPFGSYSFSLSASNLVSGPINKSQTVYIEQAITQLRIQMMYVNNSTERYGYGQNRSVFPVESAIHFKIVTNQGTGLKYNFNVKSMEGMTIGTSHEVTNHIRFPYPGKFVVRAVVFNNVSKIDKAYQITLLENISGLNISHIKPVKFGKKFSASWYLESGTAVTYRLSYLGSSEVITSTGSNRISRELSASKIGIAILKITASNLVSPSITTLRRIIIEEPLEGLLIHIVHGVYVEVFEMLNISYTFLKGSNPKFSVSFGDESPKVITQRQVTNHSYGLHPKYYQGFDSVDYNITATAWNKVSKISAFKLITVHKPIIPLSNTDIDVSPTRYGTQTIFTLNIGHGSDFECRWNYRDGGEMDDCCKNEKYLMNGRTNRSSFENLQFRQLHMYVAVGVYATVVTCRNRLSSVTLVTNAVIQEPVTGLKINCLPFQTEGKAFNVSWTIHSGTNVSFTAYFGEDRIPVVVIDAHNYLVQISEDTPFGEYFFTVSGSNLVSGPGNASCDLFVEQSISMLNIKTFFIDNSAELPGYGQNASVFPLEKQIRFRAIIKRGSAARYNFTIEGQDGLSVASSTESTFTLKFPQAGQYKIKCYVYNNVSQVSRTYQIILLQSIQRLIISSVPPAEIGVDFSVSWSLISGTEVSYNISFLGVSQILFSKIAASMKTNLKASKVGTHRIYITAKNLISQSPTIAKDVIIEEPLTNLVMKILHSGSLIETYEMIKISYVPYQGSDPKFAITFGDENPRVLTEHRKVYHSYGLHSSYYKGFNTASYNITVTAWNNVSKITNFSVVTIHKPVLPLSDIIIDTSPSNFTSETPFNLTIVSGSDFECHWRYGDDTNTEFCCNDHKFLSDGRINGSFFQNIRYSQSHIYASIGVYNVTVTCHNRLGSVSKSVKGIVQESIRGLKLLHLPAQAYGKAFNVSWSIAYGSDVDYSVMFGLTSIADIWTHTKGGSVRISSNFYQTAGIYHFNLVAQNLVTIPQNITYAIVIQEEVVSDLQIKCLYMDSLALTEGHGENNLSFPIEQNVTCKPTSLKGSNIQYSWILSDSNNDTVDESNNETLHINFPRDGQYTIQLTAYNDVSRVSKQVQVNVLESVGDLFLYSDSPKAINKTLTFTMNIRGHGNKSCFILDTQDGRKYYYKSPDASCFSFEAQTNLSLNNSSGTNSSFLSSSLDNSLVTNSLLTDSSVRHSTPIKIIPWNVEVMKQQHIYYNSSSFSPLFIGYNLVSRRVAETMVFVSEASCGYPNATIKNAGKTPFYAARVARAKSLTIYTKVAVICEYTSKTKFRWHLYRFNNNTGRLQKVKLTNSSSAYAFDPLVQRDLVLKPRVLPYGLYQLRFTVEMDSPKTRDFKTMTRGYLDVYASPLEALIEGGALIRRGFGKKLKFDGSKSFDPDVGKGNLNGKCQFLNS